MPPLTWCLCLSLWPLQGMRRVTHCKGRLSPPSPSPNAPRPPQPSGHCRWFVVIRLHASPRLWAAMQGQRIKSGLLLRNLNFKSFRLNIWFMIPFRCSDQRAVKTGAGVGWQSVCVWKLPSLDCFETELTNTHTHTHTLRQSVIAVVTVHLCVRTLAVQVQMKLLLHQTCVCLLTASLSLIGICHHSNNTKISDTCFPAVALSFPATS